MESVLFDTLGFVVKALVVFVTFAACVVLLTARMRGRGDDDEPTLKLQRLNDVLRRRIDTLRYGMLDRKEAKAFQKELKERLKSDERFAQNVFVLDFKGDIMASRVDLLRDEITAVLGVAQPGDEVVVRLESPGGAAHSYGLAAAQLARVRERQLPLTVCVDRVAASGGYMMACVADRIVAAPFAILGSIGVAAPLPNVHRLLQRMGIDYEDATAGEYKRTVSPLAEVTEEGRRKFQEQIEEIHTLFKQFVHRYRPSLDIDQVATGEAWMGSRAIELGLANELMTSDELLMGHLSQRNVYRVWLERPRNVRDRIGLGVESVTRRFVDAVVDGLANRLGALRSP